MENASQADLPITVQLNIDGVLQATPIATTTLTSAASRVEVGFLFEPTLTVGVTAGIQIVVTVGVALQTVDIVAHSATVDVEELPLATG
jgi:hypothetical protein